MCWKMVLEFNKAIVTRDMLSIMCMMQCVWEKVVAKARNEIEQADYFFFSHSVHQVIRFSNGMFITCS